MAIPDYPINPTEQYLDAMVRGHGNIPDHPVSRVEQYLEAMVGSFNQRVLAAFPSDTVSSAAVASFEDGADDIPLKSLVVNIDPVQDLHGYENPWPAGGSANRFDEEMESGKLDLTTGADSPDQGYMRAKNYCACEAETTYYGKAGDNPSTFVVSFYASDKSYISYLATSDARNKAFTTPANAAYFRLYASADKYTHISINYPSTVTDYVPYSNLCPISGWTGANVFDTGKNLVLVDAGHISKPSWYPYTWEGSSTSGKNGLTVTRPNSQGGSGGLFISGLRHGKYTLSTDVDGSTAGNYRVYVYYSTDGSDINQLPNNALTVVGSRGSCVIDIPTDTYQVAIRMCASAFATGFTETKFNEILLELGETATDYQPYTGRTVNISWETEAGTVYGGSLVLNQDGTADLTVDKAGVDMGSISYSRTTAIDAYDSWSVLNIAVKPTTVSTEIVHAISSIFKPAAYSGAWVPWEIVPNSTGSTSIRIVLPHDAYATSAAVQEALTGQTLCYELATPVTYHIEDVEIVKTLLGTNNIWADTGNVSAEYRADVKQYINKVITAAIAAL